MRNSRRSPGAHSKGAQRHSGFSRRDLVKGAAGAGLGLAAMSRGGTYALAQDEIPITPSTATVDGTLQVLQKLDFHPCS
jgi:hypothetical protein